MADVFISYSRDEPEPTKSLAAELRASGYDVWYDTHLVLSDVPWRVIREEITAAGAVIVVWSRPAIDSDWVYSEAKTAHSAKKLICVRTPDLLPDEVPLPFNGFEVGLYTDHIRICEALDRLLGQLHRTTAPTASDRMSADVGVAWEHIKDSGDVGDFEEFDRLYGEANTLYGRLAKKRMGELNTKKLNTKNMTSPKIRHTSEHVPGAGKVRRNTQKSAPSASDQQPKRKSRAEKGRSSKAVRMTGARSDKRKDPR